jgi:hypothetical protein
MGSRRHETIKIQWVPFNKTKSFRNIVHVAGPLLPTDRRICIWASRSQRKGRLPRVFRYDIMGEKVSRIFCKWLKPHTITTRNGTSGLSSQPPPVKQSIRSCRNALLASHHKRKDDCHSTTNYETSTKLDTSRLPWIRDSGYTTAKRGGLIFRKHTEQSVARWRCVSRDGTVSYWSLQHASRVILHVRYLWWS